MQPTNASVFDSDVEDSIVDEKRAASEDTPVRHGNQTDQVTSAAAPAAASDSINKEKF
jgi:hypothetical protein